MYITVKVPDNTARLFYAECEGCYETEQKPITMGMIVKVEQEFDINDIMNQRDGNEHFEQPRQIGFQPKDQQKPLDKQKVMEWVEEMEDDEGVRGGKYTWHQVQQYAMNMGITGQQRLMEMYWAMNAMYADYHKAAKKFGVDKPEFYAHMAKCFLEDPDAVDNKVEEYVKYIVKR